MAKKQHPLVGTTLKGTKTVQVHTFPDGSSHEVCVLKLDEAERKMLVEQLGSNLRVKLPGYLYTADIDMQRVNVRLDKNFKVIDVSNG